MNYAPALPWLTAALLSVFSSSACAQGDEPQSGTAPPQAQAKTADQSAGSLLDPKSAEMTKEAPATFKAKFETSEGDFVVQVTREWSPNGADRFYNLVRNGYYDGARFFRVLDGFMAQFGINGDPAVNKAWMGATIKDDPVKQSNKRGMVTFAQTSQPNSRGTQLFINYADNSNLDGMGFAPIGEVVEGMAAVDSLYGDYGEGAPDGGGPDQMRITAEGNKYLNASFPKLDFIRTARIVQP